MSPAHRLVELELLRRGAWFGSLPDSLQARILEATAVRHFRKGELLLREGDPPSGMYALLQGRTRHVKAIGDGEEVLMHVGEPGLWIGEYAPLCGRPHSGSAIADTTCRTLHLSQPAFERLVDEDPRRLRYFALLMGERYAMCYRFLAESRTISPEQWLYNRLVGLTVVQSAKPHDGVLATITLSQTQLASMVGLSRQTLNALLQRLEQRGLLQVGYRKIVLLDRG